LEKVLTKLQEFPENKLSENVLVPLFSKVFNCKVEFSGGGIEKGKDLIVFKKCDTGLFNEYISVQVKKSKLTPNSSVNSYQQLINQLSQAKKEAVVDYKGDLISISKIFFVTPYPISERTNDTHKGALKEIVDMGVKIIDGLSLVELVQNHAPDLYKYLKGESKLAKRVDSTLTNKALMQALSVANHKTIDEIFCESGVTIGNNKNQLGFLKVTSKYIKDDGSINSKGLNNFTSDLNFEKVNKLLEFNDRIRSAFGSNFILGEPEELRNSYQKYLDLLDKKLDLTGRVSDLKTVLNTLIYHSIYEIKFSNEISKINLSDINEIIKLVEKKIQSNECTDGDIELYSDLKKQTRSLQDLEQRQRNIKNEVHSLEENKLNIELDFMSTASSFNESLVSYSSHDLSVKDGISNHLIDGVEIFRLFEELIGIYDFFEVNTSRQIRLNGSIDLNDALCANCNLVLLGEAGSGKTTNLQIYTKNLIENNDENEDFVIFANLHKIGSLTPPKTRKNMVSGLLHYLHELGEVNLSLNELSEVLRNGKSYVILDSMDEAIVEYDWILDDLKDFSEKYSSCKVVTSSRFSVENISKLGFPAVSLLPFTDCQKREFFTKWFDGSNDNVDAIVNHLEQNRDLDEIVTNPLSATILALLQSKKIPLPSNEASLYKKRFELMSGHFDMHKNIKRVFNTPEVILTVARHLAFYVHSMKRRDISQEAISDFLVREYEEHDPAQLRSDLITHSEILLLNPDGTASFGHLRFQEFLTSEHLILVRGVGMRSRLIKSWWRDVFVLYAQHAFKINWIIEEAGQNGYLKEIRSLISVMIDQRKASEAIDLKVELNRWISTEIDEWGHI